MKNKLVRKSNFLVEAAYKLSAVEQKIILVLASMIKLGDREFAPYSMEIRKMSHFIGLDTKADYAYLKDVTKALMEKVFVIRTPESVIQTHWLSSAEYFPGSGVVEFTFDPKLKPFLLQLKERFTTYRLHDVVQLRSAFSIRLYELLKEYEKVGTRAFEVLDLKKILGLDDNQYPLYADFKKRVIVPAQKELAARTDITFTFEEIKTGRAITKLRFLIKTNANYQRTAIIPEEILPDPELESLCALLPAHLRHQSAIRKLLALYRSKFGNEHVARNIEYTNAKSNAAQPGAEAASGNYRNYLKKALAGDFGLAYKEDNQAREVIEERLRQEREAKAKAHQAQENRDQIERENLERARIYQESLTPEAQAALWDEAFNSLDESKQDLVRRKSPGTERLMKMTISKICLERMKISAPEANETASKSES